MGIRILSLSPTPPLHPPTPIFPLPISPSLISLVVLWTLSTMFTNLLVGNESPGPPQLSLFSQLWALNCDDTQVLSVCVCRCLYIYIERERQTDRQTDRDRERERKGITKSKHILYWKLLLFLFIFWCVAFAYFLCCFCLFFGVVHPLSPDYSTTVCMAESGVGGWGGGVRRDGILVSLSVSTL